MVVLHLRITLRNLSLVLCQDLPGRAPWFSMILQIEFPDWEIKENLRESKIIEKQGRIERHLENRSFYLLQTSSLAAVAP